MRTIHQLSRLYALTDRRFARLPHEEIVAQLLLGGARLIQLRDKEATARETLAAARKCLTLTRAVGALLIINDHVDVAVDVDADGVHLGQEDLQVDEARAMVGPNKIIGLSTHSLDQFRAGLSTSADYLAVGPVYATSTKENPSPVVGLELLRKVRDLADRPVVAIGGITPELAPEVISAGADTIAVVSALYPPPDPDHPEAGSGIPSRVRAFLDALNVEGPIGQIR